MEYWLLVAGTILCATLAIRAKGLLTAALWLAGVSVFTALILYLVGAKEVAVIELSVGAGLVTVLFVFAIAIAGDDAMQSRTVILRPLAAVLVMMVVLLIGFLLLPAGEAAPTTDETPFAVLFWEGRALDVLVQIVLIFAGVLGVLGLLAEPVSRAIRPAKRSTDGHVEPEPELPAQPTSEKVRV
jgi:NADH:ubiquinone oxidoreductase subunit 6 (subunit J)